MKSRRAPRASTASSTPQPAFHQVTSCCKTCIINQSIMSQITSSNLPQWDPRSVLDVWPKSGNFTCVGVTQRGARCRQWMFSAADKREASEILDDMAALNPQHGVPISLLQELASVTLCGRWHRKESHSQVSRMASIWQRMIRSHCAEPIPIPVSTERIRTRPTVSPIRTPTELPAATVPPPTAVRTRETVTRPQQIGRTGATTVTRGRPAVSRSREAETLAPSHIPTETEIDAIMNWLLSSEVRSERRESTRSINDPPQADRTESASSTASNTPEMIQSPSRPSRSSTSERNASRATTYPLSPRRKPLTDPCFVCMEHIALPDDAVWCRAQCGQNVHRACFNEWRTHCLATYDRQHSRATTGNQNANNGELARLRSVKCMFCRTPWRWEWED